MRMAAGDAVARTAAGARSTRTTRSAFVTQIPFADFGATLDPPSEDVTAHIVEALALLGVPGDDPMMRRAAAVPMAHAGARRRVVRALGRELRLRHRRRGAGADRGRRRSRSMREYGARSHGCSDHQNGDGGWGETCASYDDPSLRGRGESTASQTAWALLALLAADDIGSEGDRARRAVPRRNAGGRRAVGRGRVHGHGVPARLHAQVPPLSQLLADVGARTLPAHRSPAHRCTCRASDALS